MGESVKLLLIPYNIKFTDDISTVREDTAFEPYRLGEPQSEARWSQEFRKTFKKDFAPPMGYRDSDSLPEPLTETIAWVARDPQGLPRQDIRLRASQGQTGQRPPCCPKIVYFYDGCQIRALTEPVADKLRKDAARMRSHADVSRGKSLGCERNAAARVRSPGNEDQGRPSRSSSPSTNIAQRRNDSNRAAEKLSSPARHPRPSNGGKNLDKKEPSRVLPTRSGKRSQ